VPFLCPDGAAHGGKCCRAPAFERAGRTCVCTVFRCRRPGFCANEGGRGTLLSTLFKVPPKNKDRRLLKKNLLSVRVWSVDIFNQVHRLFDDSFRYTEITFCQ